VLDAARPAARARPARVRTVDTVRTLAAFALLAAYGVLRWATMLVGPPAGRLAGLVLLACAIAALGGLTRAPDRRLRIAANVAIVAAALAMLPMSGIPLEWIAHARIAQTSRAIGNGLSQIPLVLVPYRGGDPWTRTVILLGAGMLMLGGALTLATSPQPIGEMRLGAAALPLVVLATVPSALSAPRLAWLHGLVMFLLLAVFVLGGRLRAGRVLGACLLVVCATAVSMVMSPSVGNRRPWISLTALASKLGPGSERFDWSQTYDRLDWPQDHSTVLTVRARWPYYWKAENLDQFNGRAWVQAPVGLSDPTGAIDPANLSRWTQTLTVTLRAITTSQVIVAGVGGRPTIAAALREGDSPGTYVSDRPLLDGTRYQVDAYTPRPSAAELAAAGERYPLRALAPDLTVELPAPRRARPVEVGFAAYGSALGVPVHDGISTGSALQRLEHSPYGRVWALSQRLKAGTTSPFQYVLAVTRFLHHGFTYDQSPPPARYPLLSFLFGPKLGYCQQFAGAMALLLRMGGIPARVAVGFTTGTFDRAADDYVVTDLDAHAWVEAWFPGYGWISLDPTPSADPALLAGVQSAASELLNAPQAAQPAPASQGVSGAAIAGRHPKRDGSSSWWMAIVLLVALLTLGGGERWRRALRGRPGPSADRRLRELERALARCDGDLSPSVTLSMLERRFAEHPEAAAYIRGIQRARFAAQASEPTAAQRRALRRALARGNGVLGPIRALLALPPSPRGGA
jgi:transglutaminase-like putative cysteine protease